MWFLVLVAFLLWAGDEPELAFYVAAGSLLYVLYNL